MQRMRRVSPVDQPEPEEQNVIASNVYEKSNSRVGKLMRELQGNVTQKGLVLLLVEIAERPETSVDFDIPLASYLNMFLQCREAIIMSEAGHLILSAARIYSRRVDQIYDATEQMVVGMEKSIKATEESKKTVTPKPKRAMKRPRTDQNPLYEAEMAPKQLKTVPLSKTTEILSSVKTFESPKNFFRDWEKYKDWRVQHTKKMKCPIPYSVQQDNVSLHPSLWKLSSIEDFDYEDDTDTKRNYQVFTNYVEHRHNTLVSDINFIMHFKVKDFIEAEEDEIEIMSFLGLPPPPKRTWPPICKGRYVQKNKEKDNENISEMSEDYIRYYVELENALLECDTIPSNKVAPELIEKYKSIVKGNTERQDVAKEPENALAHNFEIELNLIIEKPTCVQCTDEIEKENIFEDTQPCRDACVDQGVLQESAQNKESIGNLINRTDQENVQDKFEKLAVPDVPLSCSKDSGFSDLSQTLEETSTIENTSKVAEEANIISEIAECNAFTITSLKEATPLENDSSKLPSNENKLTDLKAQVENTTGEILSNKIKSIGSPENIDSSTNNIRKEAVKSDKDIIIRLSIDDGVALSDLDEIDRAMLSPVVELVDILKPIISQVNSPTDVIIHDQEPLKNFLDLDYALLNFNQDFTLPFEVIFREADININMFKIPEHRLRRNCFFKLPEEYKIYQKKRAKRKGESSATPRTIKLYKLSDGSPKDVFCTPPQSPSREEDFYGFMNSPIPDKLCDGDFDINKITNLSKSNNGTPTKTRSVSQDSGCEDPENLPDNSLNCSSLDETQSLNNNSIIDSSNLGLPILQSTAIQDSSTLDVTLNDSLNTSANTTDNKGQQSKDNCNQLLSSGKLPESPQFNLEDNTTEMITKVQNWHRYLKPILNQSKDRHHFDVFAIGSEILEKFPQTGDRPTPPISFDTLMQDKDPSYISRYFLSTLLLANQNNVRLEVLDGSKEEPTPLSKIQLTLLSRKRHTVSVEDDVGAPAKKRSLSSSNNHEQHSSSSSEISSISFEQEVEHEATVRNNDEQLVEILKRHRETNRDLLIKEIQDHRDDYIRILSKKYSLDLELYFTPDEMKRLQMDKDMVSCNQSKFEEDCLIYPKKINLRRSVNKTKNCDDADSGFHSQNTTELESAVVS